MLFGDLAKKIEIDFQKGVFHEKNTAQFITHLNEYFLKKNNIFTIMLLKIK